MSERNASLAMKAAPLAMASGMQLQRKCACGTHTPGGGKCAECSKRKRAEVQTKLQVNEAGDIYELEADRIADRIATAPASNPEVAIAAGIRRLVAPSSATMDSAPASVEGVVASSGRPLQPKLREQLEQSFGHDFSRVRIHEGGHASESAQAVQAQAYTVGSHIVFNEGKYAPETRAGRHLLTHELVHVVQQDVSARNPSVLRRKPPAGDAKEECHIRNARAYIYFEIARRFNDPTDSDPRVLVRARCLKKAFGELDAASAIEFAQQIMQRKGIYTDYMRLHHATRLEIAEILVARINQKDTASYEARLLTGDAFVAPDTQETPAPQLTVEKISKGIKLSLDKPMLAIGSATLMGPSECDKYTFGFTQFVVEEEGASEYYFPDQDSYYVIDQGLAISPLLPCHDVFNVGDIWSYSRKLECDSKGLKKDFGDDPFFFDDTPVMAFADAGDAKMLPSAFKWREKFVTVFYATLPNDAVHFFSWFDWTIAYCKTFPHTTEARKTIADLPSSKADRQVSVNPVQQGRPAGALAALAGKPAPKICNDIAHNTKALSYPWKVPLIKC
jgi:Domain of unknown function (DUF4157)